jgi:hypothetical protein
MQQALRAAMTALMAFALIQIPGAAMAQAVKQVRLTEKQVLGFIAAQKDMGPIAEKMLGAASDAPDPKIQAELQSVARQHGFASFNEYDDVATSISMVMAGIDPETKAFTDPQTALKQRIAEIQADKAISAADRKQMLDELNGELKSAVRIQFPGNIELVKKYYDQIDEALN